MPYGYRRSRRPRSSRRAYSRRRYARPRATLTRRVNALTQRVRQAELQTHWKAGATDITLGSALPGNWSYAYWDLTDQALWTPIFGTKLDSNLEKDSWTINSMRLSWNVRVGNENSITGHSIIVARMKPLMDRRTLNGTTLSLTNEDYYPKFDGAGVQMNQSEWQILYQRDFQLTQNDQGAQIPGPYFKRSGHWLTAPYWHFQQGEGFVYNSGTIANPAYSLRTNYSNAGHVYLFWFTNNVISDLESPKLSWDTIQKVTFA